MKIEMYRIFFEIQRKHWWFVTKKNIILDVIRRHFSPRSDTCVLDVGCGSGLMLSALENIGRTSGMDMSDEAIAFSREIFKGVVRKGFLPEQVPYDEESFDLITVLDVIEHLDADVDALKTMRSRLRPGGKMIVTVPAYMFLWSNFDVLNEHKRRYTRSELRSKLQAAGLTIEKISYFNSLLFPVVFVVRKLNSLLKCSSASDTDMPSRPMNFILKMIFGLEKYLLRFVNLPFGVSILAVVKK